MLYPDSVIQVFCKAPIVGSVKTRLITETFSAEQAMQVHIELTERTLQLLSNATLCPIQLWCSPSTDFEFFQQLVAKYSLQLYTQSTGDLGERMFNALNTGLQQFQYTVLIGCDCPSFNADDFKQALNALKQGADVVLAPTEDGGYSLIGLTKTHSLLFNDMPWGTAQVLPLTRQRIKQLQLKGHEIRQQWDVDTPDDLARFEALLDLQAKLTLQN